MIERCAHTGLMQPECSCTRCLVALVDTHAPGVRASNVVPLLGVREPAALIEREDPEAMVL